MVDTITILEYIGVFAFAISGANVAIQEKLDLLGIYILATVTAMGGGIIRDIVVNEGIPVFFNSQPTVILILCSATLAILLKGRWKYKTLFAFIDAIGLAAFVVSSGLKGIENGYNLMLFLFVTSITGVGGGMLRDIITNRKPDVFRKEIYCIAGMIGALILWFMDKYVERYLSVSVSLILIIVIRMICYLKNINLPIIVCPDDESCVLMQQEACQNLE